MLRKGEILYQELSEQIWDAALTVRRNFGSGHKESLYQEAFADELAARGISAENEKKIVIYHPETGTNDRKQLAVPSSVGKRKQLAVTSSVGKSVAVISSV